LNFLEDTAYHLSVLLLYAFRQQSNLVVRTDIPTRRVASYTIVAKRLDGWRRHFVRK